MPGLQSGRIIILSEPLKNTNHKIITEQILNQTDESARNETMKYLIQIAKLQAGMLTGAELNAFVNKSIDNI